MRAIISENQKYIAELTPFHQCGYKGRGTVYQMNGKVKGKGDRRNNCSK